MNNFELEIWDDEAEKCTFYTVRWQDAAENETDKFFKKYNAIPELKIFVQHLLSLILDVIGDDYGAIDPLFNRFENDVIGLPNKGRAELGEILLFYPDFPLRLYALRINNREDIVVLFNGGFKTSRNNQGSADLHLKWMEACRCAKRIEEAIRSHEIIIDTRNRKLLSDNGDDNISL